MAILLVADPYFHVVVLWIHAFLIYLQVTLEKEKLSTELKVKNTDQKPFSFTTALHTYFSVSIS